MTEEILENPITGECLRILESTPERFKVQYSMRPHSEIPGAHYHPDMQQRVTVLSGAMHLRVDGKHHVVHAGESVTIPTGGHHFQWNPSDTELVAIEEVSPASRLHQFFAVLFRLAADGQTDARGFPSPLLAAVLFREFRDSICHASLGMRLMTVVLAPIASLLGYRRRLDGYLRGS